MSLFLKIKIKYSLFVIFKHFTYNWRCKVVEYNLDKNRDYPCRLAFLLHSYGKTV